MATQRAEHLDIQKVGHVNAFARILNSFPYELCIRLLLQKDGNYGRGVEDDQGPLAEVARVVSVPYPPDSHLRRLVYFDWLELRYLLEPLLHGWFSGYLLYLGE